MGRKVAFVHADDWVAMYVDGALVAQGHSLQEETVVRLLTGENPTSVWAQYQADEEGSFPDKFEDVREDH